MTASEPSTPRHRRGGRYDEARRGEVLDVTLRLLASEAGFAAVTTSAIAREARTSKQSLQEWFGGKDGLLVEAIAREARRMVSDVRVAVEGGDAHSPHAVLEKFGQSLVKRLLGTESVAINRAAMTSPHLAELLHGHGRQETATVVQIYLQRVADGGQLQITDPVDAYETLLGLLLSDWQVGRIFGVLSEPPPSAVDAHVARAVGRFLIIFAPVTDG